MGICPICNGFKELTFTCPSCYGDMVDQGKLMDYYDDYSPYMPIDDMKLENGFIDAETEHCVHLYQCEMCGTGEMKLLKE